MSETQQSDEQGPIVEPVVMGDAEARKRNLKPYIFGIGGLVGVVLVGWVLCAFFVSKVSVGGVKLAARADDKTLTSAFTKQTTRYRLTIKYPDAKTEKFDLKSVGFTLDSAKSLSATRTEANKLGNRLEWWRPVQAKLVFKENTRVLNDFTAHHISITAQPSQDAALAIVKGKIQITDAVTGKQYGLNSPEKTLRAAVASLQTMPVKLQTLDVNPALTAKLLQPYKLELEKIMNQPANLTIGDRPVTPSPEDIASWLDITPNDKSKKVDITVNSGKVLEYINRIAAAYIHPARAEIDITMPDGTTQVLTPGVSGVDVLSKSTVSKSLATSLMDAKGFDYTLPLRWDSFKTVTTGYHPKWIEVDLTNKRTYAFENTTLVATFLASAGAPSTPTVQGEYTIYAKYAQQNMQGENVDGSNYYQPHVQWINYFYRDYAIHGNYWRPLSYFGNINSSHGCVGLVNSDALWIYNWAPIGTPVVVHT
jgi:hypothetical protein